MTQNEQQGESIGLAATGIPGFDALLRGGLPAGRTTLVSGGPGCGKTVLALQTLVHGANEAGEPGIFVAFEEKAGRIVANASGFGWDLPALQEKGLFFLDARPGPHLVQSGEFDIGGLLAALEAKIDAMGARRLVFDAIDVPLALLDRERDRRLEMYRLQDWLENRGLTALVTAKASNRLSQGAPGPLHYMEFMVDCSVQLEHAVSFGISQRNLRIIKRRGSNFDENATPFVIGPEGISVAVLNDHDTSSWEVGDERLSTGIERLDGMLDGGYHRAAGVLITGAPGTAKTTLCGNFAEAACERGEPVLFVTFDSRRDEIVRNLASVSIDLRPAIESGLLHFLSARSIGSSAEAHLMTICRTAEQAGVRHLVIDPISALGKTGNAQFSHSVAERLIDWCKRRDITLLCTSLLDHEAGLPEGTPLQISTIADTWIHLSYVIHAGERNRGLSIVKSRGTDHSNQVRELVLSDDGVTLADVYSAGGEVLMGALRYERERADELAHRQAENEAELRRIQLEAETAELESRIEALTRSLEIRRREQRTVTEGGRLKAEAAHSIRSGIERRRRSGSDE